MKTNFFSFSILIILFLHNLVLANSQIESEDPGCSSENIYVNVLTDSVCENSFIIDVKHDQFDPSGSNMQCIDRVACFYIYDSTNSEWVFFNLDTLSSNAVPTPFVGIKSFDIFNSLKIHLNSSPDSLKCGNTYKIRYLVSVIGYWDPHGGSSIDVEDTLYHDQEITYKCQIVNQVNVSPSQLPITTCGEDITLSTNFSSDTNYAHTWHHISPTGQIVSTNNTATVGDDGWYYVFVDNANMVCDSGRGQTRIDDNGFPFPTSISSSGPNSILCNPKYGGLSTGFPILSLDDTTNYQNHSFQWHYNFGSINNFAVPFATTNQHTAKNPGDFFLVTTNLNTGCTDTSNIITIESDYSPSQPFELALMGDTAFCIGESISNSLLISPTINQPRIPPFWTFELYNGSNFVGTSLNNISTNGNYWVLITSPAGCVYYTDTILININTLPLPSDSITFDQNAHLNDIYCFGDQIGLVNHDYPSPGITHDLYINGNLVASSIFSTSGTYGFQLLNTRWNQITVIAQSGQQCSDTLFDHQVFVVPEGCCNNLSSLELLYGRLDNGITYSGKYLVVEDLLTDYGAFYDMSGGDFGFMGVATKALNGLGGSASAPNIYVEDSSTLHGTSSVFYGFCDTMWGGIYIDTAATFEFDSSYFEDSYVGITPNANVLDNPTVNMTYKYNGLFNIFRNNYISLTYYANRYDLFPRDGIIGGIFTSDPDEMLFPYDLESNYEQPSYSFKAIDVYSGNSHSTRNNLKNVLGDGGFQKFDFTIENHIYGIYLNQNAQFDTLGNTYIDNALVAGYFVEENPNDMYIGYDSIVLQTQVPNLISWQQNDEYQNKPILEDRKYGLFSENRNFTYKNSRFYGDGESLSTGTDQDQVYGLSFDENGTVALNEFHQMDVALELRGSNMEITVEDNIMDENVKSLKLANGVEVALDKLGCNHFTKDTSIALTQYGIYVEAGGSILEDIGGDGSGFNPDPAGNGWPVDIAASTPPYPFTNGGSGTPDVYDWFAPDNWYSIYDANAISESDTLSYFYWRYPNEFFGEDTANASTDAVYPTTLVLAADQSVVGLANNSNTCANTPDIYFPQARIQLNMTQSGIIEDLVVFPNPTKSEITIYSPSLEMNKIEVIDLTGDIIYSHELKSHQKKISLSGYPRGMYIIKIDLINGQSEMKRINKN